MGSVPQAWAKPESVVRSQSTCSALNADVEPGFSNNSPRIKILRRESNGNGPEEVNPVILYN